MPRLKGLDEMRRPRRTLRQRYFRVRASILGSKHFSWVWPVLKVAIVLLIVWMGARLLGFPLEKWLRKLVV